MVGNSRRTPLLRPLALLYGLGVKVRNYLFDIALLPRETYPIPVICVGNISVGGTGKTPHVEEVLRLLTPHKRVAVLSRGYKRKTKGLVLASETSTSADIGDEPQQIRLKYPNVLVVVDADRRRAMRYLMSLPEGQRPEVVVMDDGYQHRYVRPSFSILLVDATQDILKDHLLPEGNLREPASARYRAQCVVFTKCPESLTPLELKVLERNLMLYPHQKVFFTRMRYRALQPLKRLTIGRAEELGQIDSPTYGSSVVLLTAIANPQPFETEMGQRYRVCESLTFGDHHYFSEGDLARIRTSLHHHRARLGEPVWLITTEKDAVRLLDYATELGDELLEQMYYQPIEVALLDRAGEWEQMLRIAAETCPHTTDK